MAEATGSSPAAFVQGLQCAWALRECSPPCCVWLCRDFQPGFSASGVFPTFLQQERRLFTNFHRQLFCWLDKWVDLTMEDIRRMEDETKRQLDEVSASGMSLRWASHLDLVFFRSHSPFQGLEVNGLFSAADERERPSERHVGFRRVAWIP